MSSRSAVLAAQLGLQRARDLAPPTPDVGHDRPTAPSRSTVPATADIAPLLPYGGLSTQLALDAGSVGAAPLLWRFLAGPTASGAWCALLGLPSLFPLSGTAAGVDLARLAVVEASGPAVADAAGALVTGVSVLALPTAAVTPRIRQRLAARARRAGCALIWWGTGTGGVDAALTIAAVRWPGLRANVGRQYGTGRLAACALDVRSRWRSGPVREATIWPYGGQPVTNVVALRARR